MFTLKILLLAAATNLLAVGSPADRGPRAAPEMVVSSQVTPAQSPQTSCSTTATTDVSPASANVRAEAETATCPTCVWQCCPCNFCGWRPDTVSPRNFCGPLCKG
jgi:hypothetical protein